MQHSGPLPQTGHKAFRESLPLASSPTGHLQLSQRGFLPGHSTKGLSKAPEDTIKAEDSLRPHLTWPRQSPLAPLPSLGPSGPARPPSALPLCPTSKCWPPPPSHRATGFLCPGPRALSSAGEHPPAHSLAPLRGLITHVLPTRACLTSFPVWSLPGTPLQYSCLENPMDGGAWWAAVHGVAKSRTRLSNFTFPFHFHALEKKMATHSSVLAWRIPGMGEPGGLPSMGSHRVGHD